MSPSETIAERNLDLIRKYLDVPVFKVTGAHLKLFPHLGDSLAISILKVLYPSQTVDDLKLKKILTALSLAFEHRDVIISASDRVPAVSLCLLEALLARPYSLEQKDSIRSVIARLRKEPRADATAPCPCLG
jgi:hypothetical protein